VEGCRTQASREASEGEEERVRDTLEPSYIVLSNWIRLSPSSSLSSPTARFVTLFSNDEKEKKGTGKEKKAEVK